MSFRLLWAYSLTFRYALASLVILAISTRWPILVEIERDTKAFLQEFPPDQRLTGY